MAREDARKHSIFATTWMPTIKRDQEIWNAEANEHPATARQTNESANEDAHDE